MSLCWWLDSESRPFGIPSVDPHRLTTPTTPTIPQRLTVIRYSKMTICPLPTTGVGWNVETNVSLSQRLPNRVPHDFSTRAARSRHWVRRAGPHILRAAISAYLQYHIPLFGPRLASPRLTSSYGYVMCGLRGVCVWGVRGVRRASFYQTGVLKNPYS